MSTLMNASAVPVPRSDWQNPLPRWILDDPAFARLKPGSSMLLQAIANKANAPDAHGNLMDCYGGKPLFDRAHLSRSAFFRNIRVLEASGFVVCTATGFKVDGCTQANIYAIPGQRGGLDHLRVQRKLQRMVHVGGGVYHPQTIGNDGAAGLFVGVEKLSVVVERERGGSVSLALPSVNLTRGVVSKWHTTIPFTIPNPYPNTRTAREPRASSGTLPADLDRVVLWLDRIGWRSRMAPRRRAELITRDPRHAMRCFEKFQQIARTIGRSGEVRSPAALFDRIFTGQLRSQ